MVHVKFMSLTGKFTRVREETFSTFPLALAAVTAYAEAGGYTNVAAVTDDDPCSLRYTARTPGGRGGRNVAFADFGHDSETGG